MSWNERLAPARAAWVERTAREQVLLAGLALVLAVVLGWYAVLSPALSWRDEARSAHAREVARYEAFIAGLSRYRALSAGAQARQAREPLRTVIGRTAQARGLAISRVQPLDDGGLGVWLDTVGADPLIAWLDALERQEGVRIDRVSLDREADGVVRAQLLLSGASP